MPVTAPPGFTIAIDVQANGRLGTGAITVADNMGVIVHNETARLTSAATRNKVAARIAEKTGRGLAEVKAEVERSWNDVVGKYCKVTESLAAAEAAASDTGSRVADGKLQILVGPGHDREVIEHGLRLLAADPELYTRGGAFVHIDRAKAPLGKSIVDRRGETSPVIVLTGNAILSAKLDAAAHFYVARTCDGGILSRHPATLPDRLVTAVREWPHKYAYGTRNLEAVTTALTMRAGGVIVNQPGYDVASGTLYIPSRAYPSVPTRPTIDGARKAAGFVLDLVKDFPFAKGHHRSAWLSLFLTLCARAAVDGEVPLFSITANQPGCGKDLLADLAHLAATGRVLPVYGWPASEAERDKRMLAIAMAGDPAVLLGNMDTPLGGPTLEKALTSTLYRGRLLGATQIVEVALNAVFIATGNNLTYTSDGMSRRVISTALYYPEPNPELRTEFKHADVKGHAREHHPEFVVNGLTILRAFHEAGRPDHGAATIGSFEQWGRLIRNAILWLGLPDPDLARQEVKASRDTVTESLLIVLRLLETGQFYDSCGDRRTTVRDLLKKVEAGVKQLEPDPAAEEMRDALIGMCGRARDEMPSASSIGCAFRKFKGNVVGGYRLDDAGDDRKKTGIWRAVKCETR